jgi:intracellular septation protein A
MVACFDEYLLVNIYNTVLWIFCYFIIFVSYILTRKIPKVATFSACILGFFCGLTIFFDDEYYIKIKPTIINLIFAGILFYGNFMQKPMLKYFDYGKYNLRPNFSKKFNGYKFAIGVTCFL